MWWWSSTDSSFSFKRLVLLSAVIPWVVDGFTASTRPPIYTSRTESRWTTCNARSDSTITTAATTTKTTALSNDEIRRYSRHLVLAEVGIPGQEALKDAAVLVIGAGGLGSSALLYMAAAGVGQIGIVDADTVDESNLQRQIIHSVSTVGISKCESSLQSIQQINPNVNVRLYKEEFTAETAERIVSEGFAPSKPWTVVIDGSDNFPTKYLIKYVD
jgi:tRNA A37 threonylcarbamoyladenosine dehydratase